MPFRSFRGGRRRSMPRPVINSFKMVVNTAPASVTASTQVNAISLGTDLVAKGQATATAVAVPTGSQIKFFEIQHALGNLATTAAFIHGSIQLLHDGQSLVGPDVVGGSKRRNQVMHQWLYQVGENQSNSRTTKFKVPAKFQRVREGDAWQYVWKNSQTVSSAVQIIYKIYT